MSRGKFIVLEGAEGVGKTTQTEILLQKLREGGRNAEHIREPGGDPVAEKVREILLDHNLQHQDETELLLFNAARVQTLAIVESKLAAGIDVVSDRNALSSIVYQGYARGLNLGDVRAICDFASRKVQPDLLLILDAPAEVVNTRRDDRGTSDRFEAADESFHEKVRAGYRAEAKLQNLPIIDASLSVDEVATQIWQKVQPLLN